MGDYAIYIWSAYGVAFGIMAWMALSSVIRMRKSLRRLSSLEEATGRRRNREDET